MALTEQVGPHLCLWRRKQTQLSECCVVWGNETMDKLQKASNLNTTIDRIDFDLLDPNPEWTAH
jgi:hypothetical protein